MRNQTIKSNPNKSVRYYCKQNDIITVSLSNITVLSNNQWSFIQKILPRAPPPNVPKTSRRTSALSHALSHGRPDKREKVPETCALCKLQLGSKNKSICVIPNETGLIHSETPRLICVLKNQINLNLTCGFTTIN